MTEAGLGRKTEAAEKKPQADMLIELARQTHLFHDHDGVGFADIQVNGHRETWQIRSSAFRRWLSRRFYVATSRAPSSESLKSAINIMEAKAQFDGPEYTVHTRVGCLDGQIYLDLVDEHWRVVQIDTTGWHLVDDPPVRFVRAKGMQPLPLPVKGGSIETLRAYLNVASDADFTLAVAWLLAALSGKGPYPVMAIFGEQGSAKSSFSRIMRLLVDPNSVPLRGLPREERELFIAADNGYILAFDNVSLLNPWLSDAICRIATGGGYAVRQLFKDRDEALFSATRPIVLNGIEDFVVRSDLADRCLFLTLEPIPDELRRTEAALCHEFELDRPYILGVLLDAIANGIRRLPSVSRRSLPRMADFGLWVEACEPVLWREGSFSFAYDANRNNAVDGLIDADPVAAAVRLFMTGRTAWTGTASNLLSVLTPGAGLDLSSSWPKSASILAGRLRRVAALLRKIGIEMTFFKEGRTRTRKIRLGFSKNSCPPPSASSALDT